MNILKAYLFESCVLACLVVAGGVYLAWRSHGPACPDCGKPMRFTTTVQGREGDTRRMYRCENPACWWNGVEIGDPAE